ncbi:hypothetical protein JKP88DRAFT_177582 [Tribonema minus]|uniref:TRP C-terminal domain-containing protein n=1 Tax=Tribonema minus TaxID=303371 RepID=A0A835ZAG3_9STRA|nr:hypothetical protein JKP88DRAFT_177582 [Tribonema minus]
MSSPINFFVVLTTVTEFFILAFPVNSHADCAVCQEKYAAVKGYGCVECSPGAVGTALAVLIAFVVAVALCLWVLLSTAFGTADGLDAAQTGVIAGSALKLAHIGLVVARHLRTPVIVLQVLTQFVSITGVPVPSVYLEFLHVVDVLTLDLRWLPSAGCLVRLNFYQRLCLSTLVPLGIAVLLLAPRAYLWCRTRSGRSFVGVKLRRFVEKDLNILLVFAFLIFSGVSLTVFQTFVCETLNYDGPQAGGTSYLLADYSLECGTPRHTAYTVYAVVMVAVYPIGIPAMFAVIIRQGVRTSGDGDQPAMLTAATSFLRKPYAASARYWECAECLRRLMLTTLLMFIMPGTAGQTAVACVFALFTGIVYESFRPHRERGDEMLYRLGYSIISATMFTSLLMQVKYVDAYSQSVIGVLLVVLNVLLLLMALAQSILVFRGVKALAHPVQQNSWFGIRRASERSGGIDAAPSS